MRTGRGTRGRLSWLLAAAALHPSGDRLGAQEGQGSPAPRALRLEAVYMADVFSAARGGRRADAFFLDNLDLKAFVDPAGFSSWRGALLHVYVLSNRGEDPGEFVGDAQGLSNIAAPAAWRLYEAWLQQTLAGGRLSLLAGLYDVNSEFDVIESAANLINSSFGIGAEYGQAGRNGPSIFPVTSLGLRVRVRPLAHGYLQLAALDGVPGDPEDPGATVVRWSEDEGLLLAAEVGLLGGPVLEAPVTTATGRARGRHIGRGSSLSYDAKLALGAWWFTSGLASLEAEANGTVDREASYGLYLLGEATVVEPSSGRGEVDLFARAGLARASVNRFAAYLGAGVAWRGPLPGRPADELAAGVATAINGDPYVRLRPQAAERAEVVAEVTYRAQLLPWLALQPDVQWILNPDTDPTRPNALAVGLRGELAFAP